MLNFSISGFTENLIESAEEFRDGRVELIDMKDFQKWAENFFTESGCFDIEYPFNSEKTVK